MELHFVKFNPSGNTTVLILDSLPRNKYAEISAKVMKNTNLCAEQVGFLEPAEDPKAIARLQMMGGEFCGNASRSFAAWIALGGLDNHKLCNFNEKDKQITIETSGYKGPLTARVQNKESNHSCFSEIQMPLPQKIIHGRNDLLSDYSVVIFEGILHVILWNKIAADVYIDIVKDFLEEKQLKTDCFGVMFFDKRASGMIPVVYVKAVESLVWESSCGSGSIAVASALAHKKAGNIENMKINQPGGELFVRIGWQDGITDAHLSGDVIITAIGTVYID
jgi:diaminopimelate epimerase